MHHTSRQIYSHLQNAKKIVLVCHQNPDGDTLGSASALTDYLTKNNKQVTIFCLHDSPNDLVYLPHLHLLTNNHQLFADHSIDTIITIDCGDLRYAGIDRFVKNHPATIINIDHHPTNEKYGQINLVSPTASSVAEILYLFFRIDNNSSLPMFPFSPACGFNPSTAIFGELFPKSLTKVSLRVLIEETILCLVINLLMLLIGSCMVVKPQINLLDRKTIK